MSTTYTSGQTATGTVSDFQEILNSGAKGQYQSVINTGQIVVNSGATLIEQNGSSLYGPYNGGKILVYSGGTLVGGSIGGGGVVLTTPGATISGGLVVQSGGVLSHWSNKTSGATLAPGAMLYVQSGGNAAGIVAGSGANIIASAGGTVSGTVISNGGGIGVAGTASNTIVSSGGVIEITSGGKANGNTIDGGSAYVDAGGVINSATLENSGRITVSAGASANNVTVETLAALVVNSGATVSGTVVSAGGGIGVAGTASATTVTSGGIMEITSGGKANGNTINGGSAYVDAGGVINSATLENSGKITVSAGGSANNVTVETLAALVVSSGATVSGTVVSAGGGLGIAGTASATTVNSGGVVEIASSGKATNNTVNNGGTLYADANSVLGTTTVSSGGQVSAASGTTLSGALTLQNGGLATLWNNAGGSVDLQGSTNGGLTVSGLASGGTLTTVISGFDGTSASNSDVIKLDGVKAADVTSVTYPDADHVKLTLAGGASVTLNIIGAEAAGYTLGADSDGDLVYEVCFLADSLIKTPTGDCAVQTLRLGDDVVTYDNGQESVQKVVWAGQTRATVRPHLPMDEAGYPVRILKNAIAEGVPYKDMLITAEHCLYFDGKFVPARMLVNGRSVFYDTSITTYDYYHIETATHSVIMADGMLTESYLDTGNRKTFRQEGAIAALRSTHYNWEDDAAAPLCVEQSFVEPIFRSLAERSEKILGMPACVATAETTNNPDLHLVTETGGVIRPLRQKGSVYSFMLPPNTATVRVVSRASRPADTIGPFVDDRRELGVAIGTIQLVLTKREQTDIVAHLQADKPEGWHGTGVESQVAWTNGNAVLPLGDIVQDSMGILSLTLHAAGPYLLANSTKTTLRLVG
ncbi:Hint domain-containing protein [Acetobacter cibinongensis]|uniref:Hint domain-containing protein n=1 Tax=Acetobacter cibinongensis TaxID=146475 RepID=UPI000A39B943|nr:Hint domain-containing protein [Acetobacter cibinongensis]